MEPGKPAALLCPVHGVSPHKSTELYGLQLESFTKHFFHSVLGKYLVGWILEDFTNTDITMSWIQPAFLVNLM